ncbi:hypothetical protein VKT23_010254 [Stygiomarasmius scandens]|uniref:Uncharacterized protein n=1 Tax=Marasmiellus scandens TaxID=2682957 RepID=A0ABR1JDF7_9AGAR
MSSWSSEFSDALFQAATALRVLSDIYDAKKPMNLRTFDIASMDNTSFSAALLTTSTALFSLSTTFNADIFPDGEVVERAWNSRHPASDNQPPPLDPPIPPTRPSTPTSTSTLIVSTKGSEMFF